MTPANIDCVIAIKKIQELIDNSMNLAIGNGYDFEDWDVKDIALDLANYDVTFENINPVYLIPFIEKWITKNIV